MRCWAGSRYSIRSSVDQVGRGCWSEPPPTDEGIFRATLIILPAQLWHDQSAHKMCGLGDTTALVTHLLCCSNHLVACVKLSHEHVNCRNPCYHTQNCISEHCSSSEFVFQSETSVTYTAQKCRVHKHLGFSNWTREPDRKDKRLV